MSYKGTVKNGVVVLPPEVKLPHGTQVEIVPGMQPLPKKPDRKRALAILRSMAGLELPLRK